MGVLFKPIFEILTGEIAIFDNVLNNYFILVIVGEIAYQIAWHLVRSLLRIGIINDKYSSSIVHWIIRITSYMIIAYIIRLSIFVAEFITSIPYYIWFFLISVIVIIFYYKQKNKHNLSK